MLILIICLFSHYVLVSCVNYEKAKFDESLLMNQYHRNFLKIKDFIQEALQKFHEANTDVLRLVNDEQKLTSDKDFMNHSTNRWENTSSIYDLNTQTFPHPIITRPSFPVSITHITTELYNRLLKWEDPFPSQSLYIRPSASRLHIGPRISSLLKPPPKLGPRQNKKALGPPTLHKCTRPLNTKTTLPNTSVRGHSVQPFGSPTTLTTKSRRFHSKARKRKHHHDLQKRHKARERHKNYRYRRPEYGKEDFFKKDQAEVEYGMLGTVGEHRTEGQKRYSVNTPAHHFKKMRNVTRLTENRRHRELIETPNALLQYSEGDDTEDDKLIKFIEGKDESVRKTAQKHKTSFYHQVKESLKQAELQKKAKRLRLKAELLRKIVDGSSYSDEEASLTKNLIQALEYGNVNNVGT